jgi:glutamate-5-semialdehyde dehydrogenase
MVDLTEFGKKARAASRTLALASSEQKNQAILTIADCLLETADDVLTANQVDLEAGRSAGLSQALLDRLMLDQKRLQGMADDLKGVAGLPDPIGEIIEDGDLPTGLHYRKVRVPLGVLAVIYESRPNVTLDVTGLALKSGNSAILRGGSETIHTNRILARVVQSGLVQSGLPGDVIQLIDDTDRALVLELLRLSDYVDMVIPRGGAGLHDFCRKNSRIPVITGGIGICHLFVDETADLGASVSVIQNAKVQRPSVCNALDTILVHQSVANEFVPAVALCLAQDGVRFRADPRALPLIQNLPGVSATAAGPEDFDTEWLSLVLGIKVVDSLEEAIAHIGEHSTGHSDGILTKNQAHASAFITTVDSAAVYVNASTRFTDGSQLGLGAEVAISTQRLHARGPMGLRELTTYKWVIEGNYHIRA